MDITPIKTEKDYKKALIRLELIFDSKPGTKEGNELDILALLVERYEDQHYAIDAPDPIEAIKFRMDQMGYKQKDLEAIIGYKGHVSEILNKKRKLTLEMIRKFHEKMDIPLNALIQAY